jgi:hypothetical protein
MIWYLLSSGADQNEPLGRIELLSWPRINLGWECFTPPSSPPTPVP